jgi:hypothetical protein
MNVCLLGEYSTGRNKKIHARQDYCCDDNPIVLFKNKLILASSIIKFEHESQKNTLRQL